MLLDAFVSVMTDFVLSVVDNERALEVKYLVAARLVLILRKGAREDGAGAMVPLLLLLLKCDDEQNVISSLEGTGRRAAKMTRCSAERVSVMVCTTAYLSSSYL